MMTLNPLHNRGFSIIEVLIAVLVLALGILAVVKLQGVLVQSASDSNHRATAVSLAQQKIDDLRGFTETADFLLIDTDQGGQISATGGAFSIARENYRYSLAWGVEDYFHLPPADEPVSEHSGVAIPVGATPDFKIVNVFVAWEDETGALQQVTLETIIDSYPPGFTSASAEPSPGGVPPRASYSPEGAPDVIDIAVDIDTGSDTKRQTSKPLPDVVKTGQDGNTIVSFDVMTYESREGSTGDFVATRQEEFVTVDCNCRLAAAVEGVEAMTPAHAVWDDVSQTRFDVMGKWVSKQTAVEVDNANDAEKLCAVCCRDHHDATDSPVKYVPDTATGNHVHYKADGSGVAAPGDVYAESCRLKRVDGILRVYQDWNLVDITILDRLQLFDGQALQGAYQGYVEDLIFFEVVEEGTATKPTGRLSLSTNEGVQLQLESRGVYIDEVYDFESNVSEEYLAYVGDSTNSDRLEKVPFSEVNLTLLSNWISAEPAFVSVTNDDVATIADPANDYYGTYSRGYIGAIQQTTGVDITTTIRPNNDGFTQLATPPFDEAAKANDTVSVVVEAAGDAFTVSGTYEITFPLGKSNPLTVSEILTPEGSGSCTFPGTPGNTYTCSVNAPWTGSLKIKAEVKNSCSGESVAFQDGGENTNVTKNFASFACE